MDKTPREGFATNLLAPLALVISAGAGSKLGSLVFGSRVDFGHVYGFGMAAGLFIYLESLRRKPENPYDYSRIFRVSVLTAGASFLVAVIFRLLS